MKSRKTTNLSHRTGAKHSLSPSDIIVTRGLNRVAEDTLRQVAGNKGVDPVKEPSSMHLDRGTLTE